MLRRLKGVGPSPGESCSDPSLVRVMGVLLEVDDDWEGGKETGVSSQ